MPPVKTSKELQAVYSTVPGKDWAGTVYEGETADFAVPRGLVVKTTYSDSKGEVGYAYFPALHHENFQNLEGKILTVCDASFPNEKQCEAVKQLFKNELREWFNKRIESLQHSIKIAEDN